MGRTFTLWSTGGATTFTAPHLAFATGVNDAGQVWGARQRVRRGEQRRCWGRAGRLWYLAGTGLERGCARDINDDGVVVGEAGPERGAAPSSWPAGGSPSWTCRRHDEQRRGGERKRARGDQQPAHPEGADAQHPVRRGPRRACGATAGWSRSARWPGPRRGRASWRTPPASSTPHGPQRSRRGGGHLHRAGLHARRAFPAPPAGAPSCGARGR
jgi:hypothetical protein